MNHLVGFVDCLIGTTQIVCIISWFLPWLLVPFIPVMACAAWIAYQYLQVSRELKRLENIKKSPVFVLFSETLNGLSVIRAFRKESLFFSTCCQHVDAMNKCHMYLWISNRWLHIRVGMLGTVIIGLVGVAIVYSISSGSSVIGAPEAGLALMYSLSFCENLLFLARAHAEVSPSPCFRLFLLVLISIAALVPNGPQQRRANSRIQHCSFGELLE